MSDIEMPANFTFTDHCCINEDGNHRAACVHNQGCLRHKDAHSDLVRPLWARGGIWPNPWAPVEADQPQLQAGSSPEYPQPSTYWDNPRRPVRPNAFESLPAEERKSLEKSGLFGPIAWPAPIASPPSLNVRYNTAELVQPKPIRLCENPKAKSQVADFLARWSEDEENLARWSEHEEKLARWSEDEKPDVSVISLPPRGPYS